VGLVATAGVLPDCVYLLDMCPGKSRSRMGSDLDRMESRGDEYRRKLRDGFLAEAAVLGESVHIIDADRTIEEVQQEIREIAARLLSEN
jgi:dTMP kinase